MRRLGCVAIVLAACTGSSGSTTAEEPRQPAAIGVQAALQNGEQPKQSPQQPPATEPTNRDAEFDATVAQVLRVFAALGKAVDDTTVADRTDCPRAASALTAVLDDPEHARAMAANEALAEDAAVRGRLEAWTKAHMDELVDVLTKVQTAGAQCKDDSGFQAFLVRFEAL